MNKRGEKALRIHVIAASSARRARLAEIATRPAQAQITTSPGISLERIGETGADVVIIDVDSAGLAQAAVRLAENLPDGTELAVLVDNPDSRWIRQAIVVGVSSILSREITADELQLALAAAATGLVLLQPISAYLLAQQQVPDTDSLPELSEALTAREHEVLRLVSEGLGNKEIAAELNISEHTVKFHISSILGKLSAGSRTEAVSQGIRRGWIPL